MNAIGIEFNFKDKFIEKHKFKETNAHMLKNIIFLLNML